MRAAGTMFTFAVGLILGAAFLIGGSSVIPRLWLPLGAAVLLGGIGDWAGWSSKSLRSPFFICLVSGICFTYVLSSDTSPISYGRRICLAAETVAAVAFVWGLAVVLMSRLRQPRAVARSMPYFLILIVMASLIGYVSSGRGGAGPMHQWLLAHGFSPQMTNTITFYFRKGVHFTFYGTFAALALRGGQFSQRDRAVVAAMASATVLACFDEIRQSGYASRTGTYVDVLLDLCGASVFVTIMLIAQRQVPESSHVQKA